MSRRLLAAALIATLPLASGCASGLESATVTKPSIAEGDGANLGDIQIRNAHLAPPLDPTGRYRQGEAVPLYVTIVNRGAENDALVSATSEAATEVRLAPAAARRPVPASTVSPSGEPAEHTEPDTQEDDGEHTEPSASAEAGGADSPSPSASAPPTNAPVTEDTTSATPAATATATAQPAPASVALPLPIPNTASIALQEGSPVALQLFGLMEPVQDGQVIDVQLRFEKAGSVTLQVPVSTGEYYEGIVREREEAPKENKDTGH